MIDWLQDPRAATGEAKLREAERQERRSRFDAARSSYREAAEAFASVAISVPTDCPNMRGALAVSAVACFGRAGAFDRAVDLAYRFLAEPGGLSKSDHGELVQMARDYAELIAPTRKPTKRRAAAVRDVVRHHFSSHPEAA